MPQSREYSIGKQLRCFRLSSGLSQEALSERSGVSARTISDLERGQRNVAKAETLQMLADALRLSPEERSTLMATASGSSPVVTVEARQNDADFYPERLPVPPNRTVGRTRDIEVIRALVTSGVHRVVTLTGPGGVGKTRVATMAAAKSAPHFEVGVHFVPLASVSDPLDVPAAVATSFGLPAGRSESVPDRIGRLLDGQSLLLVLDNFEQILPAAEFVHDLAEACESITILITSRAPLRLSNEQEVPISPLAVLSAGEENTSSPAVELFVDRSHWMEDDRSQTDIASIGAICRRLDGLPLAIELAADSTLLRDEDFASAFQDGQRLSSREAFDVAMAVQPRVFQHSKPLLTTRETEVLELVATGLTNSEIADRLYVSQRTVDGHVATILGKLDVGTRQHAVASARKLGIVPLQRIASQPR